jgi:ABC-type Zn2+ transport system substrate-binding protein/surface adhesin
VQGQFTIEQADTEYVVNFCIVMHADRQTDRQRHRHTHTHHTHTGTHTQTQARTHARAHTHTHTHTHTQFQFFIYCLPLTNWSCTTFVTIALSSHDYGQQIVIKTAQQCSTRTHVLSVTDTTHHNTALCCTFIPVRKNLAHISERSLL